MSLVKIRFYLQPFCRLSSILFLTIFLLLSFTNISKAQDWPELQHYRQENAQLEPPSPGETRVVFMGNSITELWVELDSAFLKK